MKAGQKVIVADVGCVLYDGDKEFQIKRAKLRGHESNGMICAEDEIGIGTSHEGIIVLPDDAVVGTPAAEYYQLESDFVIEVDITANRSDALSHWGVARDFYAWLLQNGYQTSLHRPSCDAFVVDNESLPIDVEIENTEACKRYVCLSVTDCDVKESPDWLKQKLTTVGLRPINNIVDITNYVMMAYGQPMHCFDADMVTGHKIVVRTQPEGTKFVTLDGEEHTLGEHDLSICNAEEPMCIAGIFGGKGSGTYETTRHVVLEAAYFHPTWIRKSARRHGLSTDSSYRFERGIDPNGTIYAMKQAAILCRELAGGKVSMQIKDVYPEPIEDAVVDLNYDYAFSLIGKNIGKETVKNIATSLEMKILSETDESLRLQVPAYRVDVQRPCDVVEDVLRIYGYNNVEIPTQLKSSLTVAGEPDKDHRLQNIVAEQLVGCGFNEILNNSLSKESYYLRSQELGVRSREGGAASQLNKYTEEKSVKVMNPLSADLSVMRQTLLFGGLESIVRNANRQNPNLRFFEFGNCYHYSGVRSQGSGVRSQESGVQDDSVLPIKKYSEEMHLGLWLTGKRVEGSWIHANEDSSFYELNAYVQNILTRLGIPQGMVVSEKISNDIFSTGLALKNRGGKVLAELGIVSRTIQKNFGIQNEVYYADLHWTALMKAIRKNKVEYTEISKFPAVSRDLALLIDKGVEFAQIEQVARQSERKLLKKVELFDVYEGKNLPEGKKSYAVNFILQDEQRTLNDKQIDVIMNRIIDNLKNQLHAELR